MHHIYKTRAIVLNSSELKEADKQLVLLTEDFGLLRVIAQGTRKIESKLRPSIQDFSVSEVALVSGRVGWRLTNAKIDYSISAKIENKKLFKSFAKNISLLERLVLGESEDKLFKLVIDFSDFVIDNQNQILHQDQINKLESIFVINLLFQLGYVDDKDFTDLLHQKISIEMVNFLDENKRKDINRVINQSIRETGL